MRSPVQSVYFVGICGSAMASVAAAMQKRGFQVRGSDSHAYPPMSTFLADQGVQVLSGFDEAHLDPRQPPDLVVIGNAISRGNPEAEAVLERKWAYTSLPELLKHFFLRGRRSIVVTGTHGKTTTASLLAWVFECAGRRPDYLIGGIPLNFQTGARFDGADWCILEGDEYDTAFFDKRSKFIHYLPEIVVANNLEFDHADIFEDLGAIQTSFRRLFNIIPRNGLLLANGEDPNLAPLLDIQHCPVRRFGLSLALETTARDVRLEADSSSFTVDGFHYTIPLVGEFNVRNALGVVACARHAGIEPDVIQSGFDGFRGIRRRIENRGEVHGVTVLDDFGHHPTAIRETLRAIRIKYPGRRVWAVFEPRSNTTRRRVFQEELALALAHADAVAVSDVARRHLLPPGDRLDPERLVADLSRGERPATFHADADHIVRHLAPRARTGDVICVFSNGGFDGIHQKLLDALQTFDPCHAPAS